MDPGPEGLFNTSLRFLFFLYDKQELISKVDVCQTKVNKSQNLNNIYEKKYEKLSINWRNTFSKTKVVMLVIVGITIICLAVARSLNYIGDHCVIVNKDIHEKIKKDEQFCLTEYKKDIRTVS